MTNFELSAHFFLQLAILLAVCRVVGIIASKVGQPQVVAEMVAGVLLGPSLLGLFWPEISDYIFPPASMSVIYTVSQVGLALYMFLIGVEFHADLMRPRLKSATAVSLAGIVAPFLLGSLLAPFLVEESLFFMPAVEKWEAMLFLGAALSITAFPMLARIIYEQGLSGTSLGTLSLAAGAINDAAAWCILAVVLSSFSGNHQIALLAIGGGVLYGAAVLMIGKPLFQRFNKGVDQKGRISGSALSIVLLLLMLAAWLTDIIGIYAIFGSFILGAAMPKGEFAHKLQQSIEPLTTNFLLPLFFVYSGLNTRIGLVDSAFLWAVTGLVVLAASFGKGFACWLAARLGGESQRDALAIGSLMNARGLMELILLNIGLERGIITPTLFAILVMMAIITTLMASPVFKLVYHRSQSS